MLFEQGQGQRHLYLRDLKSLEQKLTNIGPVNHFLADLCFYEELGTHLPWLSGKLKD